jgi:hypothetical protein
MAGGYGDIITAQLISEYQLTISTFNLLLVITAAEAVAGKHFCSFHSICKSTCHFWSFKVNRNGT